MFSFFIAVFMFACIFGVHSYEKRFDKSYEEKRRLERDMLEEFCDAYSVSAIEEERLLERAGKSELDEELAAVRDYLVEELDINPTAPMIASAYYAMRGMVMSRYLMSTCSHKSVLCKHHDFGWSLGDCDEIKRLNRERLVFLKWYDKELRKAGIPYELQYVPVDTNGLADFSMAGSVQNCNDAMMVGFYWEPTRFNVWNTARP